MYNIDYITYMFCMQILNCLKMFRFFIVIVFFFCQNSNYDF